MSDKHLLTLTDGQDEVFAEAHLTSEELELLEGRTFELFQQGLIPEPRVDLALVHFLLDFIEKEEGAQKFDRASVFEETMRLNPENISLNT